MAHGDLKPSMLYNIDPLEALIPLLSTDETFASASELHSNVESNRENQRAKSQKQHQLFKVNH